MDTALPCLHNTMVINIINAIRVRTWHANVPTGGCYPSASEIPKLCHICGISVNKNYHRRETNPNGDNTLTINILCGCSMLRPYRRVLTLGDAISLVGGITKNPCRGGRDYGV